jgi:glutaminyl-peptide cyclotransferase
LRIAMIFKYSKFLIIPIIITLATTITVTAISLPIKPIKRSAEASVFDGSRAYLDIQKQVNFGPRLPGSESHAATVDYIFEQLTISAWGVYEQDLLVSGHQLTNIIAQRESKKQLPDADWIIIGAHYDTRIFADRDPNPMNRRKPVPGANDGASGVAVLLELARVLPKDLDKNVWLVFFDGEDNGGIQDYDWIMGSQAFVDALEDLPDAAIIVDMVADSELNLYLEENSDLHLATRIWGVAAKLGYSNYFILFPKYRILDDHIPFKNRGIPSVDIIDFEYPYWHTTQDTLDKVSADSLQKVGNVILNWLIYSE